MHAHRRHSCQVAAWKERNREFARFEIAGIAEEVPTVRLLVSGFADVTRVRRTIRQPALEQDGRINAPSLEKLSEPFSSGNGVAQRQREVIPLVEARSSVIQSWIQVIHGNLLVAICGVVVQGMAKGVSRYEAKAVVTARGERRLQGVVIGRVEVRYLVDELQVRKLSVKRPVGNGFAVIATGGVFQRVGRIDRVEVPNANQIAAIVADIVNFPGKIVTQGALNAQGPILDPRRSDVPIDGEDAARRGMGDGADFEAIAALKP